MNRTQAGAVIFLAALLVSITGCENKQSGDSPQSAGIAIPQPILAAALPSTSPLRAQLFLDGGSTPIAEDLNVSTSATEVKFVVEIAPGDHTLTIKYSYVDLVFTAQPWDLAFSTKSITVVANTTTPLDYTTFTYPDTDNDGVTNLSELDESRRTNPGDATCVVNQSIIGGTNQAGCKLG